MSQATPEYCPDLVRQWSGRSEFSPRWCHTKDSKKWHLMPPCLTLSFIRYVSRVKWSNLEEAVALSSTPRCSSTYDLIYLWIFSFTDHMYIYIYIYIYIYMCVCVCMCGNICVYAYVCMCTYMNNLILVDVP